MSPAPRWNRRRYPEWEFGFSIAGIGLGGAYLENFGAEGGALLDDDLLPRRDSLGCRLRSLRDLRNRVIPHPEEEDVGAEEESLPAGGSGRRGRGRARAAGEGEGEGRRAVGDPHGIHRGPARGVGLRRTADRYALRGDFDDRARVAGHR